MPEVKMDFIPSDNESDNDEKSDSETVVEEEIASEEEDEPPMVPKVKSKRDDMNVDEIFNMPVVQPLETNIKLTKKGKPRKKRPPMSEEHKAKLALAREKAMAARKKKAQEKKEAKELEKEEKELLKKQKVKRVKQLKEEVDEGSILDPPPKKEQVQTFSKKELEEAQLQAIMNYEKIRKSRKAEKQERQKKEAEQEALKAQLRRAVAPPQQEYNPFLGCY